MKPGGSLYGNNRPLEALRWRYLRCPDRLLERMLADKRRQAATAAAVPIRERVEPTLHGLTRPPVVQLPCDHRPCISHAALQLQDLLVLCRKERRTVYRRVQAVDPAFAAMLACPPLDFGSDKGPR